MHNLIDFIDYETISVVGSRIFLIIMYVFFIIVTIFTIVILSLIVCGKR